MPTQIERLYFSALIFILVIGISTRKEKKQAIRRCSIEEILINAKLRLRNIINETLGLVHRHKT